MYAGFNIPGVPSIGGGRTAVNAPSTLVTITGPYPSPQVGVVYSFTPTVAFGFGSKAFSVAGTLPTGLTFSTVNGNISGTPTTAASYSGISVIVADSSGFASLGPFAMLVAAAAYVAGAKFNDARNSQYAALVFRSF